MSTSYKYQFISDIGDDWKKLASKELGSLAPLWVEQSKKLKESESLQDFNRELRREWAVETGIIENLYTLDRGLTQLLIEKGFEASLIPHGSTDKSPDEVVSILKDHQTALEGLFQFVNEERDLSIGYVKELHQIMTRSQDEVEAVDQFGKKGKVPLKKGDWKEQPNNPTRPDGTIHEYCPPVHVAAEMDNLIKMYNGNAGKKVATEVLAAWLHHRFTQIHPFQDGNGRVARALASLVFIKANWFPLVISRDIRGEYIDSLEKADGGVLLPLVHLFTAIQKKAFLKALSLSEQILKDEPASLIISSAIEKIRGRKVLEHKNLEKVFTYGEKIKKRIVDEFESIRDRLNKELKNLDAHYAAHVDESNESNDFWFRVQIIDTAKALDYYADTRTYKEWVRLKLIEDRRSEIVFSIHSLGTEFIGILAVSSFIFFKDSSEESGNMPSGPHPICKEVFQFSYNEEYEDIEERFSPWIDETIIAGLAEWRRQL